MERVRLAAENVFWETLSSESKVWAEEAIAIKDKRERKKYLAKFERLTHAKALRVGLCEPVRQGLARDVGMAVGSYIELKVKQLGAQWPARRESQSSGYERGLDALAASLTKEEEDSARDLFATASRPPAVRPLTFARARDAQLVRKGQNGGIAVVLYLLNATDARARAASLSEGQDASTGEVVAKQKSKTRIIVPISCSKWHKQKFLAGRAVLRSSIVLRRGERWYLQSQFELTDPKKVEPEGSLGVDRGLVNTLVGAVTGKSGNVRSLPIITGSKIGAAIHAADVKDRAFKRRTGRAGLQHRRHVDHLLHDITNKIVATAKSQRLQVTMEDLTGFKKTIVQKRAKGARRNAWAKSLKKAQLGKVELLLEYKLACAGLPALRKVPAGGTSITCSRCGHSARENRPEQALFKCAACGFETHADANAAVQIARRGLMKVKKGDKLDRLHKNMVTALSKERDDDGLGPLTAFAARDLVAAHASATGPNEGEAPQGVTPLNPVAGQELTLGAKNTRKGVIAERGAPIGEDTARQGRRDGNGLDDS